MRHAHTVAEVRRAEQQLMEVLPEGTLMRRAATGLAAAVTDLCQAAYGLRVRLLVGSGDNGGDALWAGVELLGRGARVEAALLGSSVHADGLAAFRRAGGTVLADPTAAPAPRERPAVVVDGIVGIGGRPGLRPDAVRAREAVPEARLVAVDIPSGVDVDTGELDGEYLSADVTVTFGTHKPCHLVDPAASACGVVHLVDIGLALPGAAVTSLQARDVRQLVPRPRAHDHKYSRGVVGVSAGSAGFPGAALLCVAGAGSGLAGMVRLDSDESVTARVLDAYPEVVPGPGRVQARVVGPGCGDEADEALRSAWQEQVPVVADADALPALSAPVPGTALLTPHAGELARMLGVGREEVEQAPVQHVRRAARHYRAVVLLKGRRTLVASPEGEVRVNPTGTAWLATAGAGDVLAGLCGALLAAGLAPLEAGSVGAWLHGAAAARASRALVGGSLAGGHSGPVTASSVARALPPTVAGVLDRTC